MKQLLFLLLFPCLAMAQYQGNAGQKITLGEQTTADGLVYRGLAADTTRKPSVDTMAFILLDTNTNIIWQYKKATNNAWTRVNLLPSDTTSFNYVNTYATQSVNGAKTFTSAVTGASFRPTSSTIPINGMYLQSANVLAFSTNTSKAMEINSVGAVGFPTVIGTSKFTIDGNFGFAGTSGNRYLYFPETLNHTGRFILQSGFGSAASGGAINLFGHANVDKPGWVTVGISQNAGTGTTEGRFTVNSSALAGGTDLFTVLRTGNVGIGTASPTAVLHLKAGTATAGTAPLKFTSGVNLTSPLGGEMEFNGTNLFFSPSTTRHTVNHGLTGSATLNFPSTTTLLSADLTITVTGAADGDVVSLGVPNASVNANTCYTAWVSAANTVTVRFNNYSSGTVDPASGTFKVFVTK